MGRPVDQRARRRSVGAVERVDVAVGRAIQHDPDAWQTRTATASRAGNRPGSPSRRGRGSDRARRAARRPLARERDELWTAWGATFRGSTMPAAGAPIESDEGPRPGAVTPGARRPRGTSRRRLWSKSVAAVHAGRPSRISGPVRSSASSAARISRSPRYRRDLAVPERDPQRRRDFWQRQVEVVMQDDDRSLLRSEPAEAALELVAIGERRRRVGDGRRGRKGR